MPAQMRCVYVVAYKRQETATTTSLTLVRPKGATPTYTPGQCITAYLSSEQGVQKAREYSISSAPLEDRLVITVRAAGAFSQELCTLKAGDMLHGSTPHGHFQAPEWASSLILLAGGIGITPLRSLIVDSILRDREQKLFLYYSTRTADDAPFAQELEMLADAHPQLRVQRFITREDPTPVRAIGRRISVQDVLEKDFDTTRNAFMLCGSLSFVRDMRASLIEAGVPEAQIYTEAFY